MKSSEIRQSFLDYFKNKSHLIVPSAPMVIKNDPTLMFTNAGMNQFKDIILGNAEPKNRRVANSQKCLRVSGKHNDLEEVGHDTYHHTMFEMLGNWSFGDYFKKDAIAYAWEFLTRVMGLEKDRFYATVFGGSEEDGLGKDDEAYLYWQQYMPDNRILYGSKKDNFWEMGDTGPCGPCSELHIDLRTDEERKACPGEFMVNKDNPLVVEIWNLVFMQFNRKADGSLEDLPSKHVDTGMGFERLCMAVQGRTSNYDTDVFTPLLEFISGLCGTGYGKNKEADIAMRVIADHVRTIAFAITDGQLPSNNKAGYVIRRILRRAVRYGYTYLGFKEAFMYKLIPVLIDIMGIHYTELAYQRELIENVIREEENAFLGTLDKGIHLLEKILEQEESDSVAEISGKMAFELYDTYGFPLDLTELIARESGMSVNHKEFEEEMAAQKQRSRSAAVVAAGDWVILREGEFGFFVGYDHIECEVKIMRYRKVTQKGKTFYQLVFDSSPFYAEGGGQVGDCGYIQNGEERISITDTKNENGLRVHIAGKLPEDPFASFLAVVDGKKRQLTADNHSATHLLNYALRTVLGNHVEQKGSFVCPDYLRFDFSHFQKMTDEELSEVEFKVNSMIRKNLLLTEYRSLPLEEAKGMGAVAVFGEKYGDFVRVVSFGDSMELCGGTHVASTGMIGFFKILSEGSVSAGVRRIEAVTADVAEKHIYAAFDMLKDANAMFKSNRTLKENIAAMMKENAEMKSDMENFRMEKMKAVKEEIKNSVIENEGIRFIVKKVDISGAEAKEIMLQMRGETQSLVMILGGVASEKPFLSVMMTGDIVGRYGLNAGNVVKAAAVEIKGGGGGQPFFASAGGSYAEGLPGAMNKAKDMILNIIKDKTL